MNGGLVIEVVTPSGEKIAASSFINEGDYVQINNCDAGDYTVRVTTPADFDNRITVEGVVSSFDKAITAVYCETETVINCNDIAEDDSYFGTLNVSIGESAGIDAGMIEAEIDFDDEHLTATASGFGDFMLAAGRALNGLFFIKADPDTPAGAYTGTLRVTFDANSCDPVFLSYAAVGGDTGSWSVEGNKIVYTAPVSVTVDLSVPAAPVYTVEDGEEEGTVNVVGDAADAQLIIVTYERDYEEENDDGESEAYTVTTIAAILSPDADGSFNFILARPEQDSRISVTAVNCAGGLSEAALNTVEGYTAVETDEQNYADSFTSVTIDQVEGKRDVTVTVAGARITGLTLTGDVFYRVVDSEPLSDYPVNDAFDTSDWTNVGPVSSFTVKNVLDGQYIEVVQVTSENVYARDESGELTVVGVKNIVLRHGSAAADMEEVPGYTVSGTLIPDDVRADASGMIATLTDSADSTITYSVNVQIIEGTATYSFTDVLPGSYILSLISPEQKVKADSVIITVKQSDVIRDVDVKRNVFDVSGTLSSEDAKADLRNVTVILLDAEDNEIDRIAAVYIAGKQATYRFCDLAIGEYAIRIESDKVEADDTAFTIADRDTIVDIEVDSLIIPGDITGDRVVNEEDLERLFKYLTDWNVDVVEENLDINGDGKVNNKDLTRLYQYLSGQSVVIC